MSISDPPASSSAPFKDKLLDTLRDVLVRVGMADPVFEPGSRLHISPVPGTRVPMAFAWIGPDDPVKEPHVLLTRYGNLTKEKDPVVWHGATFEAACEKAQQFFYARPPIVPCPPAAEAWWGVKREAGRASQLGARTLS